MWTTASNGAPSSGDPKGERKVEEIPDLPTLGREEEEAERPRFDQLKPATATPRFSTFRLGATTTLPVIRTLQKPQAFWELLKLIFCKIHDERHNTNVEFYAAPTERHGVNGRSSSKARIDKLFEAVKADFSTIFKRNEGFELEPRVLAYLVSQLQMYLPESDVDVKGRAYEEIVGSNLRGDRGEFFTPRNICQMADLYARLQVRASSSLIQRAVLEAFLLLR